MKTEKFNVLKRVTGITWLVTLLILSACNQQKDSAQDGPSTETPGTVKPPPVDIHTAVLTENQEALKQHIAAGTNLNEKDPFGGSSPLITAALFGKREEARMLIEAGADINFKNNDESTPLHVAAFFCRPEIVRMLLDKGADKSLRNKFGATAYESVAAPFSEVKSAYDMMSKLLGPMGLKLDYEYIERTRPEIAAMLNQ